MIVNRLSKAFAGPSRPGPDKGLVVIKSHANQSMVPDATTKGLEFDAVDIFFTMNDSKGLSHVFAISILPAQRRNGL